MRQLGHDYQLAEVTLIRSFRIQRRPPRVRVEVCRCAGEDSPAGQWVTYEGGLRAAAAGGRGGGGPGGAGDGGRCWRHHGERDLGQAAPRGTPERRWSSWGTCRGRSRRSRLRRMLQEYGAESRISRPVTDTPGRCCGSRRGGRARPGSATKLSRMQAPVAAPPGLPPLDGPGWRCRSCRQAEQRGYQERRARASHGARVSRRVGRCGDCGGDPRAGCRGVGGVRSGCCSRGSRASTVRD